MNNRVDKRLIEHVVEEVCKHKFARLIEDITKISRKVKYFVFLKKRNIDILLW